MYPWLQKLVTACTNKKDEDPFISFNDDPLGWSLNLQRHYFGHFSMATVQGNTVMEDHSQVDVAFHNALFLGIYDGHGGPDASRFVSDNLLKNLMRFVQQNENKISETTLRDAVAATEVDFLNFVRVGYPVKTDLGKIGSCCLVGVIRKRSLHIANLGDSRAVLGFIRDNTIKALPLTRDHNANIEAIREELKALHEGDPNIVMERNGSWRVKGIIEVSRSIGDTYLKRPEFTLRESFPKYEEVPEPFDRSVLSAEPEMHSRILSDNDKFLIFASDGLWEFLSNEQAAQIVHNNPRNGIAKRLLSTALAEACRRRGVNYKRNLQNAAPGRGVANRRSFHDDISVIVVFFDRESIIRRHPPDRSFRGSSQTHQESAFIKFRPKTSLMKSLSPRKGWEKLKQQLKEIDQPSSSRAESSHARSSWPRSLRDDQAESSQAASARARPDQAESSQAVSARARPDQAESSQAASARARLDQAESSRARLLRTDEAESSEAGSRRTLSLRTPSRWDNVLQRFRSHRS